MIMNYRPSRRELALSRAMGFGINDPEKVLEIARSFEEWLLGEDADPQPKTAAEAAPEKAPKTMPETHGVVYGDGPKLLLTNVGFPRALEACIESKRRIRRIGWNGKGMFVFLHPGSVAAPIGFGIEGVPMKLFDRGDAGTATRLPSLALRTAHGATVIGWLASQTDMLASDWEVLA